MYLTQLKYCILVPLVTFLCLIAFNSLVLHDEGMLFHSLRRSWSIGGGGDWKQVDRYCGGEYFTLRKMKTPFRATVVEASGDFLRRVCHFNTALDRLRIDMNISSEGQGDWNIISPDKIRTLYEWNDGFLQSLDNYTQIETVILPWQRKAEDWSSLRDSANLLIQEYFTSTASDPLCTWIETPGLVNYAFDMINNWTCNRDIRRTLVPTSVSFLDLNAIPPYENYYNPKAFPPHFHSQPPLTAFHLHIIRNGIVNKVGDVFSGSVKILPYGCFPILDLDYHTDVVNLPLHEEVFVIAQHRGDEMFHRLSEVMPRISLYLDFLLRNPSIKIFSLEDSGLIVEFLTVLGISRERIVTGWCRAKVVYLPRSTKCCLQNFVETQVLSKHFREFVRRIFPSRRRDLVIVIRRSHYRRFKDQDGIERVVEEAANAFNLTFAVYKDKPSPSLARTMHMFNSAVMVIGPHGAGLSNVVFSEPGTFVIEGVCNLPHTNLFFQRSCLVLGHRWHGIPATDGCTHGVFGVVNLHPSVLNSTLFDYLHLMSSQLHLF